MSEIAIRAEKLGKQYRIGGPQARYKTIRESLVEVAQVPVRGLGKLLRGAKRAGNANVDSTIWALKDVSFDVKQGEAVGIIGRNGAGKSTLLKVLSRITKPTEGYAEIHGRVGSLLEVGTGFHPELTGRENIYLNGAILGMKRREIDRKFDEMVAFAEIEKFMDTPVKHYSSGMYVRLAFAVAAHLEPEILLVDEVLAVGDAEFQKKCLGKMGNVAKEGRTVLFVSHNMIAVKKLCQRAVLLQNGHIALDGDVIQVVKWYQHSLASSAAERVWSDPSESPGNDVVRLHSVRVRDKYGHVTSDIDSQDTFDVEIEYWNLKEGMKMGTTLVIYTAEGECILGSISNHDKEWHGRARPKGLFCSVCRVPGNFFPDGQLKMAILIWGEGYSWAHREDEVVSVTIHETDGSVRGDYSGGMDGVVRPLFSWHTELL